MFDLGIFYYFISSFKKKRNVLQILLSVYIMIMAVIWTCINEMQHPLFNFIMLLLALMTITLFFDMGMRSRVTTLIKYVGIGMVLEPVGLLSLRAFNFALKTAEWKTYYFVVVLCALIRGNGLYLLSKLISRKGIRLSKLPKEIASVLVMVFVFSILNCCFVVLISMEAGNGKSMVMCISIIISIVLTYYCMLYMMERFETLTRKQHDDEMYRKEMRYKEIYYSEMEKRNEYIQNLKHDIKNRMITLYYFVEKGDMQGVEEQLKGYSEELEKIDGKSYSCNPIVDSVLRVKLGIAKSEGIHIDSSIQIPKQIRLEYGDIGILYGNLLDNAIEACRKPGVDQRFIRIENKYIEGKLILVIENSKNNERNEFLRTTKKDAINHGRGIRSVRKVVEKYNGTIIFTDKGMSFEASAILYGIADEE